MSQQPVRPPRLRKGDRVCLLSPASQPKQRALWSAGRRRLESLGFRVKVGAHAQDRHGYLAGSDPDRAEDLRQAFLDPEIKAIFASRGGYGCARLLEHLDLRVARSHPKVLVGFSDLTILHLALQRAGLISFWGPMPCTSAGISPFSWRALQPAIMSTRPLGVLPFAGRTKPRVLKAGQARGELTGGTLTLLAASLGTPYEIETRGRIVFLEEVGEEPYKVDRLLTQLLAANKLKDAAGILLGGFIEAEPRNYPRRTSLTLGQVFAERLTPLGVPVLAGLAIGHVRDQVTLPYGVTTSLDTRTSRVQVLGSGVV